MNQAQHKNMADAFDLRLFQARLIKQSNANDAFLTDIHGGERQGLVKSQQLEYKLMEFEHNLWEYWFSGIRDFFTSKKVRPEYSGRAFLLVIVLLNR